MPASNFFGAITQGLNFAEQQEQQKLQRQQQLMALDDKRKAAIFQDARSVNSFLKAGRPERALGVLSDRMSQIEQLGGDPRDTKEVADLILQGDFNGAVSLLDSVEQAGVGAGFLKAPEGNNELDQIKIEKARLELEQLKSGGSGKSKKEFEKQAQFEQLQELKKNGTPEQVAEFRALIGLDKPVKLSGVSEKALDKAQESSFSAGNAVRKMELLARDIGKIDIGGGLSAGWSETLKSLLGGQDEVSNLRREFRSIRSSQAVRNLPPGVASDKDIALALSGFPREDAPAPEIISFLNGQAKLAKMEVAFNDFKSDYISTTKGISGFGKAWREQLKDNDFVSNILTINGTDSQPAQQPSQPVNNEADIYKQYGINP